MALFFLTPQWLNTLPVHADVTPARIEVWDPDLHTSNITDLSLGPGSFFNAEVNVTGAGQIGAFDVSLNYNLTQGPNVLNIASASLIGGLFDPRPGHETTTCSVLVSKNGEITIPGTVRFAATFVGGCTIDASNGILFTMIFQVMGTGAGSIDLIQSAGLGRTGSTLVGTGSTVVPANVYGAYFRNLAGIPPVPVFTFEPASPIKGDTVSFNATASYDPEQPTAPMHGLQAEPLIYDTDGGKTFNTGDIPIYTPAGLPASGTSLRHDANLLFVDANGNGVWDSGEAILYDSDNTLKYSQGDLLIYGVAPALGADLSVDFNIKYVDIHLNSIWDNGYVWDYQDGSTLEPGNFTSHVFGNSAQGNFQGNFPVKLVVYDADTGIPNRLIEQVNISPGQIHDIVVTIHLDKVSVNEGEPLGVTILLFNRGNQHDLLDMNASYNFNGPVPVASESGLQLTPEQQQSFTYTVQTTSLPAGSYTITAQAGLRNQTLPGQPYFDNSTPANMATANFIVQIQNVCTGFCPTLPVLAAIGGVIVVAIAATAVLLRRRRKEEV